MLRVPYHSSLHMRYSYFTAKIAAPFRNFVPSLNLWVILQPMCNLRLLFQHFRTKTLRSVVQRAEDARDAQRDLECASQPASAAEQGLSQFIFAMESMDCSLL